MIDLAYGSVAVWFAGLMFFAARALNYTRLILNNLAPNENFWDSANHTQLGPLRANFRIEGISIDPARLTEVGRRHQKAAILNNRMMFAWAVIGFVTIASLFSYIKASGASG